MSSFEIYRQQLHYIWIILLSNDDISHCPFPCMHIHFEPLIKSLTLSICFIIIFITIFSKQFYIIHHVHFCWCCSRWKNQFYLYCVSVEIYLSYASFIIFALPKKKSNFSTVNQFCMKFKYQIEFYILNRVKVFIFF